MRGGLLASSRSRRISGELNCRLSLRQCVREPRYLKAMTILLEARAMAANRVAVAIVLVLMVAVEASLETCPFQHHRIV